MRRHRRLTLRVVVLVAMAAPVAAAQPAARDAAAAEVLFNEGRLLFGAAQYDEACAKFAASQRLDPTVGTLLNLGDCEQRRGLLVTAWIHYREAASLAAARKDDRRARVAVESAAALERRLGYLRVRASTAVRPNLSVRCDGVLLDEALLGSAVPIDAGRHVIEASSPGKRTWKLTVETKDGATAVVDVPVLEALSSATSMNGSRVAIAATEGVAVRGGVPVASWVLGGVSIAGLVGFGVFWWKGVDRAVELRDSCAPFCTDEEVASARTNFIVADVSLGVGIAAAAGAVLLYVLRPPASKEPSTAAVTLHRQGIHWRF